MKVVYAPRALRDIDDILTYIKERSPSGAHNVSLAIEYAIHMCALSPRAGARTDEPDVAVGHLVSDPPGLTPWRRPSRAAWCA